MSSKKQFNCEICENKYKSKLGLNLHMKTVHEERKDFGCKVCNKTFGHNGSVTLKDAGHTGTYWDILGHIKYHAGTLKKYTGTQTA